MKKTIFIILILFTHFGYSQSEKIKIKTAHLKESNYLKAADFYLTHHLYLDIFLRENLFPEASIEDVSSVIKAIKKYVSIGTNLDIEIEKPGKRNYLIKIAILKQENGTELLIVFTNWNAKKKKFEKEIAIENDSYTRWYFLNGSKMTYRKDLSTKNDYSKMDKIDLANAYLFDELIENDNQIESTIDEFLKNKNLDIEDKIIANLIILKYQAFLQNKTYIIKQTIYLSELFEANKTNPDLKGLERVFNTTKFQIELLKKI